MGAAPSAHQGLEGRQQAVAEQEAIREALPRGLADDELRRLQYDLHWCLTTNDWYFTIGGILAGGALSWLMGSIKPFALAAVTAPAADWAYSRSVCAEHQAAYTNHKVQLEDRYRRQAQELRQQMRGRAYPEER
ncbi:hypothetical protein V8C86DRAFT_2872458 [Haematococcus lacustris]